jgi:hypothetical protein
MTSDEPARTFHSNCSYLLGPNDYCPPKVGTLACLATKTDTQHRHLGWNFLYSVFHIRLWLISRDTLITLACDPVGA